MSKYKVKVCRTYYAYCTVEVEANSNSEAEKKAMDISDDFGGMQYNGEDEIVDSMEIIEK